VFQLNLTYDDIVAAWFEALADLGWVVIVVGVVVGLILLCCCCFLWICICLA
jgi:hypothetical protein